MTSLPLLRRTYSENGAPMSQDAIGRWTIRWQPFKHGQPGGYKVGGREPWPDEEPTPVVPCDDAAIDRAVEAAIDFDTDNADPNRGWYLQLAREMFRAAGKAGA